jgi:hypothetical protein
MPGNSIPLRKPANRSRPDLSNTLQTDAVSANGSAPSPFSALPARSDREKDKPGLKEPESPASTTSSIDFEDWDAQSPSTTTMPSDLRPEREHDRQGGRAASPLLGHHKADEGSPKAPLRRRSTTLHERDPESQAQFETRRKYTYAAFFLALSLVSFTVQTETAVYIQHQLKWEKPYCML